LQNGLIELAAIFELAKTRFGTLPKLDSIPLDRIRQMRH
jgi:hypothetical protein